MKKRHRKELTVGIKRINIVISDKIIFNKYGIMLCKNKWKKYYWEDLYEIRIITKSDRRKLQRIIGS